MPGPSYPATFAFYNGTGNIATKLTVIFNGQVQVIAINNVKISAENFQWGVGYPNNNTVIIDGALAISVGVGATLAVQVLGSVDPQVFSASWTFSDETSQSIPVIWIHKY